MIKESFKKKPSIFQQLLQGEIFMEYYRSYYSASQFSLWNGS